MCFLGFRSFRLYNKSNPLLLMVGLLASVTIQTYGHDDIKPIEKGEGQPPLNQ